MEFKKHDGNGCPVPAYNDVTVVFEDGEVLRDRVPQGWDGWDWARDFNKIVSYFDHTEAGEDEDELSQQTAEEVSEPQPSSEQEWINGLPTIGTKCEVRHRLSALNWSSWHTGELVASKNGKLWYVYGSTDYVRLAVDVEFRPIKTDAEREREEELDKAMQYLGDGIIPEEVCDAVDTLISVGYRLKSEGKV